MVSYELDFRPENLIPDIVYGELDGKLSADEKKTLEGVISDIDTIEPQTLCRACGWNSYLELTSSYLPRLHIEQSHGNKGFWTMGNDWIIWDRPQEEARNDYMTHQFLQNQGTKYIPLVKRMVEFKDENGGYNFVVMSRARGMTLESQWKGLSKESKDSYAQQMVAALRELRQFTAEFPQRVDGSPLWDNVIGHCGSRKMCQKIGKTAEEWLGSMDEELREGLARVFKTKDETVIDARLQELKRNFPNGAPYVLTHADLNMGNILVDNGRIVAIIDWELAGYYPWWAEIFTSYNRGLSENAHELFDVVWKQLNLSIDDNDVYKNLKPVMRAYQRCPVRHTGNTHIWQRPPFCKCRPYGGVIRKHLIDSEEKHYVDHDQQEVTWD